MASIFFKLPSNGVGQSSESHSMGQLPSYGIKFFPLEKESAEPIPSHTPIAVVNNRAHKFDASIEAHQFAFAGFSINGTSAGQICKIQERGELELQGWGLTAGAHYLSGITGTMIRENLSDTNFTKVIAYAVNTNIIKIINEYVTINK